MSEGNTDSSISTEGVTTNSQPDGQPPQSTELNENLAHASVLPENEATKELYLRFSKVALPFRLPKYPEIAQVGKKYFKQEGMKCYPVQYGSETVYKYELVEKVAKVGHALNFSCNGRTHSIPLYCWDPPQRRQGRQRGRRDDGLLLTFKDAGKDGMDHIPAALFDQRVEELKLTLLIPTKMQRIKDTDIYNGNRFCVVEIPQNINVIPEFIPIIDPTTKAIHNVKVTYFGQKRYCARCNEKHENECPDLKAFYEARNKREEMIKNNEIQTKVYSDSTLRSVNTLGLRAEVCTMSGGGLGQVSQAAIDDPDRSEMKNIVIVGGANDIKQQNFGSNLDFAENVRTSLCKVAHAAKTEPDNSFFLVKQFPNDGFCEGRGLDTKIRELYLHKQIDLAVDGTNKKFEGVSNVSKIEVHYDTDETGHPTDEGTIQILKQIDMQLNLPNSFIWNEDFIKADRKYARVEAIYRYGCNGCFNYGNDISHEEHSHQLLCDQCLIKMMEAIKDNHYPELERLTKNVDESLEKAVNDREDNADDITPKAKRLKNGTSYSNIISNNDDVSMEE